jgi:tetratricopeptide (TPR) repeat protein
MKIRGTQITAPPRPEIIPDLEKIIISYKVVEKINMPFGGHTTTYVVSDLSLVNTNYLGPNNTRVITLIYEKKKILNNKKVNPIDSLKPTQNSYNSSINVNLNIIEKSDVIENWDESIGVEYIDILKTYERVYKRGYKSIEMLKRLGNAYYFKGKLEKSAQFYEELFDMTTDLEAEYYFRFARSLNFINKKDKANKMMEKYNQKTDAEQTIKN